jgi:protein-S-isoprenylcysteine O-methyltransferase Ste14
VEKTGQFDKAAGLRELIYRRRVIIGNVIAFLGFLIVWVDPYAAITIPRLLLGGLIGTAGFVLRIWASSYQWPNISRPLPGAQTGLITAGPYTYLRHPIYLSMLLLTAGVLITFGSWLAVVCVVVPTLMLNLWQANYEDAFLIQRYGAQARAYQEALPRFIPKIWAPYPHRNGTLSLKQGLKYDIGPLSAFLCFIPAMVIVSLYWAPTLPITLAVLVGSVLVSFFFTWLIRRLFKREFIE